MSPLDSIATRLNSADGRSLREIDQEIQDELSFHLEMRTEDNIRGGMSPDAARAAAAARFGDIERIRQTCRTTLLGERLMWQRLQTGLIVILLLAVVSLAYQVYSAQRANQVALAEVSTQLARLRSNADSPASPSQPPAWAAERPRVVETIPASGAHDVDPALGEIRVTFDKEMADGSWSWVQTSPEEFPESTGDVHYLKGMKTCVMPVKLKPNSKYVIWFNSTNYQNFKDREGRPAVPQLLTFTTRD